MHGHTPAAGYFSRLLALVTLMVALSEQAQAYIADDRWNRTATDTNTGSQGTPITLTWSFAPDGTTIPTQTDSNLIDFLDTNFGAGPGGSDLTQRPWFAIFDQAFARLTALCGVTYVYEPNDDGRTFAQFNSARGVLGTRGDVRIGGKSFGTGSNTLATDFFPDYSEMTINTDQVGFFTNSANNFRPFRNTLIHEAMHGLGISHVDASNAAFLIEPILSTAFDGPQLDDILALQRLYGDVYEKNGGNDAFSQATKLGLLSPTQSVSIGSVGNSTVIASGQVDILSIDDDSDTDFFNFSLDTRLDVTLRAEPRGTTYLVGPEGGAQSNFNTLELSNLSLALFDTSGTSLLGLADSNPAGSVEQITRQLMPGTYYARVRGAQDNIQLYNLALTGSVPSPANLVWVGSVSQSWYVATTENFSNGTGPARFFENDHVRFDDTSAVRSVHLPANVVAGNVEVVTTSSYTFSGPGGIVTANLSVDGGGLVELANSGNSFSGTTLIRSGTLKIAGDTHFDGTLRIEQQAELQLAGPYQFEPTARLSGSGRVSGDLVMPGTIAPGISTGTLALDNNLTLADTSHLEIELGGTEAGAQYGRLSIGGFAELDGTLQVSLTNDFVPVADNLFQVLHAGGGIFSQFDDVELPELAPDFTWNLIYSNFAVLLQVVAPNVAILAGDYNHDGTVDAADYVVWRSTLGQLGAGLTADGNANGEIDAGDYDVWRASFGNTTAASTAHLAPSESLGDNDAAVPEPASIALWLLALPLLPRRQV